MALETEDKKLDFELVRNGCLSLIKKPKFGQFYMADIVAEDGSRQPVGTTMVSFEMQPRLGGLIHMIQSVFVVKEYRKKGVFRALYTTVIENAKKDPMTKGVRLYVDHDNETAMAVYEKLGMGKMDSWNFDERDFIFQH